jgi:hypothetical protein
MAVARFQAVISNVRRRLAGAGRAASVRSSNSSSESDQRNAAARKRPVGSAYSRPRPCENTKALGFLVSLYPSRVATSPLRGDLKGRLLRRLQAERVFTRPRPTTVARTPHAAMTASRVQRSLSTPASSVRAAIALLGVVPPSPLRSSLLRRSTSNAEASPAANVDERCSPRVLEILASRRSRIWTN